MKAKGWVIRWDQNNLCTVESLTRKLTHQQAVNNNAVGGWYGINGWKYT